MTRHVPTPVGGDFFTASPKAETFGRMTRYDGLGFTWKPPQSQQR